MPEEFQIHPAYEGAGKKPGIEIWRIEQFEPVRQLETSTINGQFYNHDAYLVLMTTERQGYSKYDYDLHFWLGKYSATDEQGSAAMRAVELDDTVLGGSAVQHREVMDHESKQFLSYFKNGIRYLEGGVESGFTKVDPDDYEKRLFQVKGKKNIRAEQVECKCGSLNQGDTFVLDDKNNIYVWVGPHCETKAQLAGVELAQAIRDEERGGRSHIHIIEEDWDSNPEFFTALGSKDKTIKAASTEPDDDLVRKVDQDIVLYRIQDIPGNKEKAVQEIGQRPLTQDMLTADVSSREGSDGSNDCYVLDNGYSGFYVWTGKFCSTEFKQKVWEKVNEFVESRGYNHWISITRVVDGGETAMFKQYFETWTDPWDVDSEEQKDKSNVAESDYTGASGVDMKDMHNPAGKIEDWMPDDATGTKIVYRVANNDLEEVNEKSYGIFFGGECYVIQYTYMKANLPYYIIYYWQGINAPVDAVTASALLTMELDRKLGGEAVQIRVVMNKEPLHFMRIFRSKIVILQYGLASGFKSMNDYAGFDPNGAYMFHIRGNSDDDTRALEVEARGSSLNTNDIFIIDAPSQPYVWVGKFSNEREKDLAKIMVDVLSPIKGKPKIVEEGDEHYSFWDAIGGEEPYHTGQRKQHKGIYMPPRLFQCSSTSGRFTAEEIVGFNQHDLDETDIMLLDTFDEIFLWLGKEANEFEKQESMKLAYNYLDTDPTGRNQENTLIVCVRMGFEPPQFTGCFHGWNANMWSEGKSFHELVDEVGKENAGINLIEDEVKKYTSNYPLNELQQNPPPEGVDPLKKEMYLTDDEFKSVFGMTKEEFLEYPAWKRDNMKKDYGLF